MSKSNFIVLNQLTILLLLIKHYQLFNNYKYLIFMIKSLKKKIIKTTILIIIRYSKN